MFLSVLHISEKFQPFFANSFSFIGFVGCVLVHESLQVSPRHLRCADVQILIVSFQNPNSFFFFFCNLNLKLPMFGISNPAGLGYSFGVCLFKTPFFLKLVVKSTNEFYPSFVSAKENLNILICRQKNDYNKCIKKKTFYDHQRVTVRIVFLELV